ncbi:hypothetical protein TBK1r_09850 [Stieleria magnilauensis]|uniref:Uncharacterized protein n=1 Tax=Stieleria magnilauensis TaxID=2527963 RepID=A0ABX5XM82_9BACT|nr:hypothetical protein TBK1r_09850 [Planctomycetes bacterium TBK1r]
MIMKGMITKDMITKRRVLTEAKLFLSYDAFEVTRPVSAGRVNRELR